MPNNQQTIEMLQYENQQLREQIATLSRERDSWRQQAQESTTEIAASAGPDLHSVLTEAEAELRSNQAVLQGLLDNAPFGIFAVDQHGQYLMCNQEAASNLGLTPDQILGKTDYDIFPSNIADANRQRYLHVLATGERLTYEFDMPADLGRPQSFLHNWFPLKNATGKIYAVCGVITNITERKQQEADLRIFKLLADNALDGIAMASLDGVLTYANPAFQNLSGFAAYGMQVLDLYPTEVRSVVEHQVLPTITRRGTWQGVLELWRPDGSRWLAQHSAFVVQDETGQANSIANVLRDVTEQIRVERELQRSAAIIEQATDGIASADENGQIIMMNPAFRRMTGLELDVDVSSRSIGTFHSHEALQKVIRGGIPTAIRSGVWSDENSILNPTTGQEIPVSQVILAHKKADGSIDFLSTIVRNLTEQKQIEAEREALQQQFIDAQRNALRELSTPLIPISDDVVIMPLIGTIDSRRAQQVLETLLEGVAQYQAELVILDITGVQVVDTQVAQSFIQAAKAVRLLGAQVMLTGIQPQIAQTLVHLDIDLQGILTHGSLQDGIAAALQRV